MANQARRISVEPGRVIRQQDRAWVAVTSFGPHVPSCNAKKGHQESSFLARVPNIPAQDNPGVMLEHMTSKVSYDILDDNMACFQDLMRMLQALPATTNTPNGKE